MFGKLSYAVTLFTKLNIPDHSIVFFLQLDFSVLSHSKPR